MSSSYNRLFIIDDDLEDQEIFVEAVREVDDTVQVFTAVNGDDAMSQLQMDVIVLPDLIFLDMNMPKLNGKQVLGELKNINALKSIPVVMYSTSFAPNDIDEVYKMGAAHHLLKPARFEQLCRELEGILAKKW
jgi:CheY-like chemotaxis protein